MSNKLSEVSQMLFNKSLSTMVKGIRSHKDKGEAEYIGKCLAEIKDELKSSYHDVKSTAIQKLIYLQMLGYDISFASFPIVELMSSPWFGHKRIGYLAAALTFDQKTDVILLTTHLFRKGFTSTAALVAGSSMASGSNTTTNLSIAEGIQYEIGAALSCLANICTPDLAQDLLSDIYGLMNSSRPYIRKKAVLVLLKLFKQWPKALRLSFDRLKEKLEDENPGVVSAAVYVICELAAKNPKNYLSLAPQFFKILTTSSNNWVLIKVVKLLGSLVPLEPRLDKKLIEPLTDIISTTPAKSLLYECVNTLLSGELKSKSTVRLCLDKLTSFIEDPDQNLKYLGLLGLHKLLLKHPKIVSELKDLILGCLKDEDSTIRMRALDLITSMVSQRNLHSIVSKLLKHLDESEEKGASYREFVLSRILYICSQENYVYISDFEWYISILVELTHIQGAGRENARKINQQLLDVTIRVPAVRAHSVKCMCNLLLGGRLLPAASNTNNALVSSSSSSTNNTNNASTTSSASTSNINSTSMCEVLYAAAFIVGEFSEYLSSEHYNLLSLLLSPSSLSLPTHVQNVFLQSASKIFASALAQPFDDTNTEISTHTQKDMLKGKKSEDDDDSSDEDEEDEDDDAQNFDSYGLRKRRVPPVSRSFTQHLAFLASLFSLLLASLPPFTKCNDNVETQERSIQLYNFVKYVVRFLEMNKDVKEMADEVDGKSDESKQKEDSEKAEATSSAAPVAAAAAELNVLSLDPLAPDAPSTTNTTSILNTPTSSSTSSGSGNVAVQKSRLLSLSLSVSLLFAERLNPVHPKAQKKVAIPKGLDLDEDINKHWNDEDSDDDSDDEDRKKKKKKSGKDDDWDDIVGGSFGKKDKDGKKKKKKDKDSDTEEDYSRPMTETEKGEARERMERRKQAQMNDPFYIKDALSSSSSSSATGSSDVNDIPVRRLDDDDLPPVHVEDLNEKKKKKKKDKRGSGDEEDDDIFNVRNLPKPKNKKQFKVKQVEDLPSSDEDDEDGKKKKKKDKKKKDKAIDDDEQDSLDVDLTTPLGKDEIMPRTMTYAEKQAQEKEKEKEKEGKKKKDKKDKEKDEDKEKVKKKKDKKEKEKDEEKDKKKKSKKDEEKETTAPSSSSVLDLFDPMAGASSSSTAEKKKSKDNDDDEKTKSDSDSDDSDKKKKKKKDKKDDKEKNAREHTLYRDSSLKVKYTTTPAANACTCLLSLDVSFSPSKSTKITTLQDVTLVITPSSSTPFVVSGKSVKKDKDRYTVVIDKLDKGENRQVDVSLDFSALSSQLGSFLSQVCAGDGYLLPATISYLGMSPSSSSSKLKERTKKEDEKTKCYLTYSSFIVSRKISTNDYMTVLTSHKMHGTGETITLSKFSLSSALRAVATVTNCALVEAVSFTATYYGLSNLDSSHICILVKAKKGDESALSLEVKSSVSQKVAEALIQEVKKAVE